MPDTSQSGLVADALDVWAPTYPRRVTIRQYWADDQQQATRDLIEAQSADGNVPFLSTYSFPNGHTKDGGIPRVDTLFIDFDFEGGDYDGDGDREAWRRDLSQLLVRARRVAQYLLDENATGWRASLSGHKGVHLFLDFPPIDESAGDFQQFVTGVESYASDLIDEIEDGTRLHSLHRYVDVTSSDLGRLCRAPNTRHDGATEAFGDERYCVPVSIEELAEIDIDGYEELTSAPREVPYDERNPNEGVAESVRQYVALAETSGSTSNGDRTSTYDPTLVGDYKENVNENITLEDIKFLTSDRPCVWKFHEREDKFDYGNQSHFMESFCIRELLEYNTPIEVIKEFLSNSPTYDEEWTEDQIKTIISHDYKRYSIETLLRKAPEFCGYDDCSLCQRVISQNEDLQRQFNT